ncbi:MAG TPA: ATP-binding protein [Myxococcales bacterium]|nr:ATP-binding protein [Myxococcales bacterium]
MGPLAAPPMSTRWFRSLRTEGTVLLLVFVVALELAYAYAALSALRETTARVAAERLEEARALAQRFDGLLALGRERLGAVAEQPGLALWLASNGPDALARGAAIPQRETLHYLFFRSEIFTGPVAMVDRRSALLWTEPYDAERVAARLTLEHEALRRALAGGRPQVSRQPLPWRPGPSAVLVQPIVDLSGKPVGALLGEIPLGASKLAGFLDDPRFGSAAVAALLDGEDEPLLASPRAERLLGRATRSALPSAGTTAMVAAGETRWLAARAQLRDVPWSVVIAEDDREAFASVQGLKLRLLLTGLVLGAAALLFSLLVLGRLVRPLEVLTEAARGVPDWDFARAVPDRAPGELGDLSRAFDAMRIALRTTLQGLRDSEERYRRSIDSANDAIFALDPTTFDILDANRKAGELARCAPRDLIGRCLLDLYPEDQKERGRDFAARVATAGEGTLPEIDLASPGGGRFPVSISASMIVHGAGRFLQLICRDLSERKRMERELVQAEKLSTVGVLAAGILHELSTPLSYVQANLDQAKEDVAALEEGPRARALRSGIEDALEGSQRALTIVRDLRIFARGNDGKRSAFDVNDAVRMALRMAQHELKHRATVVTELGQVPQVVGQLTEVSQVFLNLLVNAAHAIAPGDPKRNRVQVVTAVEGERALARVSDTGAGIAPDALTRIFEPFFTTKPAGVGTGLGLAISRDILTRIGGGIRVESTVGRGTTFTVELLLAA